MIIPSTSSAQPQPLETASAIYTAPPIPSSQRHQLRDQRACRVFKLAAHVALLSDSQLADLEVAFSESNFGHNITISKSESSSDKLRETAGLINSKLGHDSPIGLVIDCFRLWSTESNATVYHSCSQSVKGTITLPIKPESLSYVDSSEVSCLLIDVKTAHGHTARVDILNVNYALEQEYLDRVRDNLVSNFVTHTYQ